MCMSAVSSWTLASNLWLSARMSEAKTFIVAAKALMESTADCKDGAFAGSRRESCERPSSLSLLFLTVGAVADERDLERDRARRPCRRTLLSGVWSEAQRRGKKNGWGELLATTVATRR